MSNAEIRGRFVWHELMTTDPQAAGAFYSKVLPWKTQPSGMPDYTLWVSGKTQAGGLMAQPESARQSGAPPSWLIYIGTPDVDATAAAAERLGGKVLRPPADIPSVGRFAVLSDPQGATFAIFTPAAPPTGAPPSDFTWHELATSDQHAALTFYAELFGWSRGPAHDMGPGGMYQLIEHGGTQVGGAYKLMDASKPPHWLTYISVANVDKAAAAAKAAGGRVTQGPMEVPGGSRIAQILDPQGGAFAVHEPPKQAAAASAPAKKAAAAPKAPAKAAASKVKAPAAPAKKKAAAKAKKRPAPAKRAAAKKKKSPAKKSAAKRPAARKAAGKKKSAKRPARKK
jgi:uncharacterized protein